MTTTRQIETFLLCVRNEGCADLELRKVYARIPDAQAGAEGYVRVVDESGEDYLYPAEYFVEVEVPTAAARALGSRFP
jgi:hypothetical protein